MIKCSIQKWFIGFVVPEKIIVAVAASDSSMLIPQGNCVYYVT